MIRGEAYAKVNLGLRVGRRRADGFHPISGIFQSVDIVDVLELAGAEVDLISTSTGGAVPEALDNLAFRAAAAVREQAGSSKPIGITLDKTIPTAAGLGGGSADAATALVMAARYFGVDNAILERLALDLGSDVPFCLRGGSARVAGRGELIESLDALGGFALAIVVPPVEVSTPAVFQKWDELDEPTGLVFPQNQLPPGFRSEGDLINDLYPAAAALFPQLDDWRTDLADRWGRPVMLSGSGPSLYGFFVDRDEAAGAVAAIPAGSRFAEACTLSLVGWAITSG